MNNSTNHIPNPSDNQPTLDELLDKLPAIQRWLDWYVTSYTFSVETVNAMLTLIDKVLAEREPNAATDEWKQVADVVENLKKAIEAHAASNGDGEARDE